MPRRTVLVSLLAWFIVGATVAGTLQVLRAQAVGGLEGLLYAGRLEPAHVVVLEQLPSAPIDDEHGHDGQIFYAIGIDPDASDTPSSVVPGYRYRRILYPALSGVFGLLDGRQLIWGMVVLSSMGAGFAAGAVAGISGRFGLHFLTPLAVVLNPGVWFSAVFLTADSLAIALGLLGLWAFLERKDAFAWVLLAAAALSRDTHIVFAIGMAGYLWIQNDRRRALRYLVFPAIPLGAWLAYVGLRIGDPLTSGDNLALPFQGILEAIDGWSHTTTIELFFTGITLLALVLGVLVIVRHRSLGAWLTGPWVLIALVSSHLVWDLGNNSIRTLAPLLTLGILSMFLDREAVTAPASFESLTA